jgi:hypothetical protein
MSERLTICSEDCGNTKKKHLSLSIKQKVELLMKLDRGMPVKRLSLQARCNHLQVEDAS